MTTPEQDRLAEITQRAGNATFVPSLAKSRDDTAGLISEVERLRAALAERGPLLAPGQPPEPLITLTIGSDASAPPPDVPGHDVPGHDVQQMVAEFHRVKGAAIARPVAEWGESRADLLVEECVELVDAIASGDPVAIMHESADVIYVAAGNAVALGYEISPVLREVHRANMSKASDTDGKLSHKGHKGAGYVSADVAGVMVPLALPAKDGAE